MKKKWLVLACVIGFASVVSYYLMSSTYCSTPYSGGPSQPLLTRPTPVGAPAVWASSASLVPDVLAEADLVVHARVVGGPEPRTVPFVGPMWAEDGTIVGEGVDTITFSDTQMEVLAVYKGSAEKLITVMQTGGMSQGADGKPQLTYLEGDPIYVEDEESVLFLVDISDDPIHAKGRTLYRVVNPAGRYTIQGSQVLSQAEFPSPVVPPKTIDELVRQIAEAVEQSAAETE